MSRYLDYALTNVLSSLHRGVSVTALKGREGAVLAGTLKRSVALTLLLGVLVVQQCLVPWMIP